MSKPELFEYFFPFCIVVYFDGIIQLKLHDNIR